MHIASELPTQSSFVMPEIQSVNIEEAYELAAKLKECTRKDEDGTTVFRGLGDNNIPVVVVVPATGNSLVVPVAIRHYFM